MMIGLNNRFSTGVASSAAVDSEKPTDTARFDSIRSISPRESIASLSQRRANSRKRTAQDPRQAAPPCA